MTLKRLAFGGIEYPLISSVYLHSSHSLFESSKKYNALMIVHEFDRVHQALTLVPPGLLLLDMGAVLAG